MSSSSAGSDCAAKPALGGVLARTSTPQPETRSLRNPHHPAARLILGAAGLGMAYGRPAADGSPSEAPDDSRAHGTIDTARALGISAVDTAPAYGRSEELLGRWWRGQVWTKTGPGGDLEASLTRLHRPKIELLQWHNWHAALLQDADFCAVWDRYADDARVVARGATVYGYDDAAAAVASGRFQVVQLPWNLLDQEPLHRLLPQARDAGVRLAIRSVLLQGILAGRQPPAAFAPLLPALERARALASALGLSLPVLALRAALDASGAQHVLVGLDDPEQCRDLAAALAAKALDDEAKAVLGELSCSGQPGLDPRWW